MNTIFKYLQDSNLKWPQKHFVFDGKKYLTYKEIYNHVIAFADILKEKEIKKSDNVILYIENSAEYIIAYFAIIYLGAVVVPINIFMDIENVEYIVADTKASLIITSEKRKTALLKKGIEKRVETYVMDINKLIRNNEIEAPAIFNELALVIYTSGTTSKPKGVMLTNKNLNANTESILDYLKLSKDDSVLVTLPFGYSYGNSLLLTHTKVGGLMYLTNAVSYPQKILQLIQAGNVTGFSTVGSYLNILLKQNNFSKETFRHIRYITFAGESTSTNDLLKLNELNNELKIFVMYGQTEASARLTYLEPDMLEKKIGSIGNPIKGVSIRIVDNLGKEVEQGQKGEIIVSGDNIMSGYLNNSIATKEVLRNGWLYTGDLAYQDEDDFLYIVGRKSDIIKYLGHRISPVEIENQINMHENILESAVVEFPDDEGVSKIKAYIVLKDKELGFETLNNMLRLNLPPFKRPHVIKVIDKIPRTFNGKIKRSDFK